MIYIVCKYCSKIIDYDNNYDHLYHCVTNYDNEKGILSCYSCGKENAIYTKSQLSKNEKARCIECVKSGFSVKFAKFKHLYMPIHYYENYIENNNINLQLYQSVQEINLKNVHLLLQKNANPNYTRQATFFCEHESHYIYLYNEDGTEEPENDYYQPTTPLKSCVFGMSNCMLTDEERNNLVKIAKLLIDYGAKTKEPLEYFAHRYGRCNWDEIKNINYNKNNFIKLYKLLIDGYINIYHFIIFHKMKILKLNLKN